jgi:queuine/archaeosine tRNA-ribosyltransferase
LNSPPHPFSLSAKIAKNTKGIHDLQNWSGEELMRSGAMRIVTSPDDMAIMSA